MTPASPARPSAKGREFVPLVQRSRPIWEEMEAATGRSLLTRNGALVLASQSIFILRIDTRSFEDTIQRGPGIWHCSTRVLDAHEFSSCYPQFRLDGG